MENVLTVSHKIWQAMQGVDVAVLMDFVHEHAEFVHMGRTLSREEEIAVIQEKDIIYHRIDFIEHSIKKFGTTEIILNRLDLNAIVKGNDVTNSFVVTEVYAPDSNDQLKLASLAFTKRV